MVLAGIMGLVLFLAWATGPDQTALMASSANRTDKAHNASEPADQGKRDGIAE
jgi:hypothetical protein